MRVAGVALVALLGLVGGALAAPAGGPMPTAEERQRLAQSEVVFRSGAAPREGVPVPGARGGIAFVKVPTGPDPVWAILTTPRRYPEIFSSLQAVEVLEETPAAWLIRMNGKVGPFEFSYYTRYRIDPEARTLVWRLEPGRDNDVFDDHWGWWRLVPEDGGTLVVYAIGSIPSSWQPLAGFFERRGIVQALTALREAAARRAGSLPTSSSRIRISAAP